MGQIESWVIDVVLAADEAELLGAEGHKEDTSTRLVGGGFFRHFDNAARGLQESDGSRCVVVGSVVDRESSRGQGASSPHPDVVKVGSDDNVFLGQVPLAGQEAQDVHRGDFSSGHIRLSACGPTGHLKRLRLEFLIDGRFEFGQGFSGLFEPSFSHRATDKEGRDLIAIGVIARSGDRQERSGIVFFGRSVVDQDQGSGTMLGRVGFLAGEESVLARLGTGEGTGVGCGLGLLANHQDRFALDIEPLVVVVFEILFVGADPVTGKDQRGVELSVRSDRLRLKIVGQSKRQLGAVGFGQCQLVRLRRSTRFAGDLEVLKGFSVEQIGL